MPASLDGAETPAGNGSGVREVKSAARTVEILEFLPPGRTSRSGCVS